MQFLARAICRFFLRFLLFYWVCFTFPFPFELVGLPFQLAETEAQPAWLRAAGEYYSKGYKWLDDVKGDACQWVGERILDVKVVIQPTGSGDTMRAYVGCLCAAVIALSAAMMWSLIVLVVHRRKPSWRADALLQSLVGILVRFYLFDMLIGYGFAKIFPLQFPEPSSSRLSQQLGDMSPMGLLWTFMGFSPLNQMFTGAVEVLGGLLLTTRRTTLLGSLFTIVAMTHIFALNMFFDVPVKLYSFHYLMMAFFLLAPDLPRLIRVLVLGKAVEARQFMPLLGSVWIDRTALVFRTVVVAIMVYAQFHGNYKRWNETYGVPPLPIAGRWEVVSMQIDKKEPDKNDSANWSWLDFSNKAYVRLAGPKPPNLAYKMTWNTEENKLTLNKFSTPTWSATFVYNLPQPDMLELQGSIDGKHIVATLKPSPTKQYELMNRGFHWIQELPYNR